MTEQKSKPEPPAWDGEGLPPVGCECEVDWTCSGDWREVAIIHYSVGKIWVRHKGGDEIIWEDASFRPIRSEEDRAIDQIMDDCGVARCVARTIYEAGYRK